MFVEVAGEKLVTGPFLNRVNNNEFKNEINEIDWKTLFDSHNMNLCFDKFLPILTCIFVEKLRNYRKRRNLSLTNHGLIITYNNYCTSGMLAL